MDTFEELGQEIASLSAHLDAASHRLLECIRRFDEACGWHEQGAVSCAHWLAWRLGWDQATAREKVRVARALGMLPAINESLRTARLSYAKVRALTRVATPENEAKLLGMALIATGAQLERLCRGYRGVQDGERAPAPEERSVRQRLLAKVYEVDARRCSRCGSPMKVLAAITDPSEVRRNLLPPYQDRPRPSGRGDLRAEFINLSPQLPAEQDPVLHAGRHTSRKALQSRIAAHRGRPTQLRRFAGRARPPRAAGRSPEHRRTPGSRPARRGWRMNPPTFRCASPPR